MNPFLLTNRLALKLAIWVFGSIVLQTCFSQETPWNLTELSLPPQVYPAETSEPGVRALYYENVPWKGQPTRVFAYYGVPATAGGGKVPAVVLVHGGMGSAFAEWVRWWNQRGYAALAMDHCGNQPTPAQSDRPYTVGRPRNAQGGPTGDGGFGQIEEPVKDQWPYQAVAAIMRAHSLLRSFPEIDSERIGLVGVSWGGYLACLTAGVDPRFRFVVPVYGCAFIGEDPTWPPAFHQLSESQQRRWSELWDPSHFLPRARMPMYWINGTNDPAFTLSAWNKSVLLPKGPVSCSLLVGFSHGQKEGGERPEIAAFAQEILNNGKPLIKVSPLKISGNLASVSCRSATNVRLAEFQYTLDDGPWKQRRWETVPVTLSPMKTASVKIPKGARAYFFNLTDERGLVVSSECQSVD